jgi:hypothetical protein
MSTNWSPTRWLFSLFEKFNMTKEFSSCSGDDCIQMLNENIFFKYKNFEVALEKQNKSSNDRLITIRQDREY